MEVEATDMELDPRQFDPAVIQLRKSIIENKRGEDTLNVIIVLDDMVIFYVRFLKFMVKITTVGVFTLRLIVMVELKLSSAWFLFKYFMLKDVKFNFFMTKVIYN